MSASTTSGGRGVVHYTRPHTPLDFHVFVAGSQMCTCTRPPTHETILDSQPALKYDFQLIFLLFFMLFGGLGSPMELQMDA